MFYEIKLKVEKREQQRRDERSHRTLHHRCRIICRGRSQRTGTVQRKLRCILYHPLECRRDSQREGRRQALLQSHVDRHIHR